MPILRTTILFCYIMFATYKLIINKLGLVFFLVQRYDPKENKWTRVASMSTRRLGVAVAVLGGFLYAVGGSDGTSPLNTGTCLFKAQMSVLLRLAGQNDSITRFS